MSNDGLSIIFKEKPDRIRLGEYKRKEVHRVPVTHIEGEGAL